MSVNLSPLAGAGWQFFDNNGLPLAAGLLYTYTAGTSTPQATYNSSSGSIANANPIVLDASGRVTNEIWLTAGVAYKFVLKDANLVTIWTYDNISGVNDFVNVSGTSLTLSGNLTVAGTVSGAGFTNLFAAPPEIGGTTPASGTFTNLTATVNAVVPTAAQYDSSTKAATTAFVQRALGSTSTVLYPTTSTALGANASGALIYCLPASDITLTLPPTTGIALGTTIKFVNIYNYNVVLQGDATDKIYFVGYSLPTNPVLAINDTATLVWTGGNWTVLEGSIEWQYQTGRFGSNLSASGYQRLPSGLLIQWGSATSVGTGAGNVSVTWPIAFPNIVFQAIGQVSGNPSTGNYACLNGSNTTSTGQFTILVNGSAASGLGMSYIALGY